LHFAAVFITILVEIVSSIERRITMAFKTPALPYAYDALQPYIDEQTMRFHHDKHHETYVQKLNAAIAGTEFETWSIENILRNLNEIPENVRTAVRNNGGGHANHSLFWEIMAPNGGGEPAGRLKDEIDAAFGSFSQFKQQFSSTAVNLFGSGWAWLVVTKDKKLAVYGLPNQDSPLSKGDTPILGLDVWEHAYYLSYQNRRAEYVESFFHLINWKKVEENFKNA
jgi:Fe-Mn family superoxide dismutase